MCQIDTGKLSLCFGYFHLETEAWSQIYDADAEFEANIDADAYIFEHYSIVIYLIKYVYLCV